MRAGIIKSLIRSPPPPLPLTPSWQMNAKRLLLLFGLNESPPRSVHDVREKKGLKWAEKYAQSISLLSHPPPPPSRRGHCPPVPTVAQCPSSYKPVPPPGGPPMSPQLPRSLDTLLTEEADEDKNLEIKSSSRPESHWLMETPLFVCSLIWPRGGGPRLPNSLAEERKWQSALLLLLRWEEREAGVQVVGNYGERKLISLAEKINILLLVSTKLISTNPVERKWWWWWRSREYIIICQHTHTQSEWVTGPTNNTFIYSGWFCLLEQYLLEGREEVTYLREEWRLSLVGIQLFRIYQIFERVFIIRNVFGRNDDFLSSKFRSSNLSHFLRGLHNYEHIWEKLWLSLLKIQFFQISLIF